MPLNLFNSVIDQLATAVRDRISESEAGRSSPNTGVSTSSWSEASISETGDSTAAHLQSSSDPDTLASKIDHTLLKADATRADIQRICDEAIQHHFATVCVNSTHVRYAAQLLKDSGVKAIAVVGFPLGACVSATKAFEAKEAIRNGAQEIDMVINLGALKDRNYALVFNDIKQVVEASHPYPVKVILETATLDQEQKIIACALSKAAGAAFVKTSTGFGASGATVEDVALMRRIVGPQMGVKASGGIRTHEDAIRMIEAGANRIGASSSVSIVEQSHETSKTQSSY